MNLSIKKKGKQQQNQKNSRTESFRADKLIKKISKHK